MAIYVVGDAVTVTLDFVKSRLLKEEVRMV